MQNLIIVGNWKANKTEQEAILWLDGFYKGQDEVKDKKVIVCPPYTLLLQMKKYIDANVLNITLGSQDVSKFKVGAYTGEVPASLVEDIVSYAIIGHSERRQNFGEEDDALNQKVLNALEVGITPIYCVQNESTKVPGGVKIVAYEPIEAIGTGNPDSPENAQKVAAAIKEKNKDVESVLYGGSVKGDNVNGFTSMQDISGVLVGGASLDPESFLSIIKQC